MRQGCEGVSCAESCGIGGALLPTQRKRAVVAFRQRKAPLAPEEGGELSPFARKALLHNAFRR